MGISGNTSRFFCPNKDCGNYGKKGLDNIVVYDRYGKGRRRLLRCRTCNLKFSERKIKFSFGLHTDESKIREVMSCLLAGKSFRETANSAGIDKDTVHRIWKKFVLYCEDSLDSLIEEFNIEMQDIITLLYMRGRKAVRQ